MSALAALPQATAPITLAPRAAAVDADGDRDGSRAATPAAAPPASRPTATLGNRLDVLA